MSTQNWKRRFVALSGLPVAFVLVCYVYSRATAPPTYHLANGIDVTPIAVTPSDSDRLLDVHVWKLDVMLPDRRKSLDLRFVHYLNGKFLKTQLGGIDVGPGVGHEAATGSHLYHVLIATVPVGATMASSHQLRCTIFTGSAGATCLIPNILENSSNSTYEPHISASDNLAYLMSANLNYPSTSSDAKMNETALVLRVATNPNN